MSLLERLDEATGPGVMDKPIFPTVEKEAPPTIELDSSTTRDLAEGSYDALFPGGSSKPSDLYRAAKSQPPLPIIRLVKSVPFAPADLVQPEYPPLARLAHISGAVSFRIDVDTNGGATNLTFESGNPILQSAVKTAVSGWKFPTDADNQSVEATIDFGLNCPPQSK